MSKINQALMPREEMKKDIAKKREAIKREHEKSRALFAGVIFFMILIVILWVFNLGNIFKQPVKINLSGNLEIKEFFQEFKKVFDEVTLKIGEFKKINAEELEKLKQNNPNILEVVGTSSNGIINK